MTITIGDEQREAEVHAVTPTMLIFRMPVDCYAPGTLVVTRGNDAPSPPFTLCEPGGCADQPAGAPCDDGDACTLHERCDGRGTCVPGGTLQCGGPCLTGACDPQGGCVVAATDPTCDDGNPCTADRCIAAVTCESAPQPHGSPCPAADRCHLPGSCRAGACDGGARLRCSDGDFCTDDDVCDPATGCQFPKVTGARCRTCRLDELRALLASLPGGGKWLGRRLSLRLDRAEKALGRAGAAERPKRARAVRRKLRAFVVAVRRGRRTLGAPLECQLTRSAKAAIANLAPSAC